ncbi:MAG TPA: TonB C-terminal domain-containing protein [Gemmatimonadales bacterium]|nr:TonB C-terminal domain-containing protein [Gemmatimonadales bacterium]
MKRGSRSPVNPGVGVVGSAVMHALAGTLLLVGAERRHAAPPVYRVQLVAAPEPDDAAQKAPESITRPAAEPPAPVPRPAREPKSTAAHEAPPPPPNAAQREAAPRTTSQTQPLPGEKPSTGNDVASVSTEGIAFPFPEYLENIVTQILQRWQRPYTGTALDAEVSFFVQRDGSITDLQFVKRSGDFEYDLEAEGAVEEAGRGRAFGPLPSGWQGDVLFVRFYFTGRSQ